jgi:hypothetical protein
VTLLYALGAGTGAGMLLWTMWREHYGNALAAWAGYLVTVTVMGAVRVGLVQGGLSDFLQVQAAGLLVFALACWNHPMRVLPDEWLPDADDEEQALRAGVRRRASFIAIPILVAGMVIGVWVIWTSG